MYCKQENGQLLIEGFHLPFCGILESEGSRWLLLSALMPWEELEETYASQFSPTVGAPAKPVRLTLRALFIKQRLGLTNEESVHRYGKTHISCSNRGLLAIRTKPYSIHR